MLTGFSLVAAAPSPLLPADAHKAASGCPSNSDGPKGILFNHISKTGGTMFKGLLREAMGAPNADGGQGKEVTVHKAGAHRSTDNTTWAPHGANVGAEGALVIQEDVRHDLSVQAKDAEDYFVIGLVRRPCDYMLSSWSSGSSRIAEANPANAAKPHSIWGLKPPYNNPEDMERFRGWFDHITANRDAGRDFYDGEGVMYMSAALDKRIPDQKLVHCWVRTHEMVNDLKKCMKQYEGCGGLYDKDGLSDKRVAGVKKLAEEAVTPAEKETHAACNNFFNKTMMQTVMDSESKVMSQYKLGSCCS
jgi:hypothetical protein